MSQCRKIVLDLCGGSGSWSKPYNNFYDVRVITLPHYSVTDVEFNKSYMIFNKQIPAAYEEAVYDMKIFYKDVVGILAAPPCESFSNQRRGQLVINQSMTIDKGLDIMNACLKIIEQVKPAFWALENPASGEMKKYLGKPRMTFQPYEFGDGWTKSTALWGVFNIPRKTHTWETCPKLNLYIRPNRKKPSIVAQHKNAINNIPQYEPFREYIKTDYDLRSITPQGFANAFYKDNR